MINERFEIRYLSLFKYDLVETFLYIRNSLKNPYATEQLTIEVENAIKKRSFNPTAYEQYQSHVIRKYPYYRIYVKRFIIFYVVIDNVMEIRRMVYDAMDIEQKFLD